MPVIPHGIPKVLRGAVFFRQKATLIRVTMMPASHVYDKTSALAIMTAPNTHNPSFVRDGWPDIDQISLVRIISHQNKKPWILSVASCSGPPCLSTGGCPPWLHPFLTDARFAPGVSLLQHHRVIRTP